MNGLLPLLCLLKWEGFLDTYYAYDFSAPPGGNRPFTTQPVRHNEPNINLAFGALKFEEENWRGRLAVQGGNSVEANTLAESSDLKYLQEAYIGKKLGSDTWLDGGIYLGHIGGESWISRDNWTYSRSINLDYVPYYSTGLRLTHKRFQFHLMNGWQNIREDNQAKSTGLQYTHPVSDRITLTYNNFFGDEEVVSSRSRFRGYHNFIFKWIAGHGLSYLGALDLGHQAQQRNNGVDGFWAASLTVRKELSENKAMAFRVEHYADPHQANILSGSDHGFQTSSASVNFDQSLAHDILWRTEVRGFDSYEKRHNGFVVTSLSISLR